MNALLKAAGLLFYPVHLLISFLSRLWFWVLAIPLIGVGLWTWRYSEPIESPRPVPTTLQQAIDVASSGVTSALPDPERVLRPTLVLPLAGDRELLVTEAVRQELNAKGRYRPVDPGMAQRLLDEFFELTGASRQPVSDADSALRIAKSAGAEVAIFGHVEQLKLNDQHAEVAFWLEAFDVESQQTLLSERFSSQPPTTLSATGSPTSFWWLGALLIALLWPPLTVPVMSRVLRMESNPATLLTIVAITAIPAVIAWPLIFGADMGTWRIVLFTVALLLTAFWTALVMSWVAASQDGS